MDARTKDISGKKFGRFTVLEYVGPSYKGGPVLWKCQCDCGEIRNAQGSSLRSGTHLSCGCTKRPNYLGLRYGRLLITREVGWGKHRLRVECRCDCGNVVTKRANDLRSGKIQSCGCLKRERLSEAYTVDMIGKKAGRLTVIERAGSHPKLSLAKWKCRCDCGTELVVAGAAIRSGNSLSCGCTNWKHGRTRTREYRIWLGVRGRCLNPMASNYQRYGAKGVKIHEEWANDFAAFYRAVGPCPSDLHSLDRFPNRNGDYVPGNVRWATPKEQARNRSTCKTYEHLGESLTIPEWAERYGLQRDTLYNRLAKGWSIVRALTEPVRTPAARAIRVRAPISAPGS